MGGNSASTFGPPTRVAPRSRPRLRGFHPSIHTRAARLRRPIPAASSIVTHPKSPRRGGPAHPTPPRWRGRRRLSRSRVKEKALQKECGPGARQEASCSRPCTPRPDTCARPRSSDVTSTGHWARQAPQDVVVGGVAWACLRLVLVAWCWLLASGTRLVRSRSRPRRRWVGRRGMYICRRVTAHVIVVVIIINHGAATETGARTTTGCNPRATVVASRRGSRAQLLARRELAWITTQN